MEYFGIQRWRLLESVKDLLNATQQFVTESRPLVVILSLRISQIGFRFRMDDQGQIQRAPP